MGASFLPWWMFDKALHGDTPRGVVGGITEVGLIVALAAVLGMLVGSVLAPLGVVTRRPRLGVTGARLCVSSELRGVQTKS